MYLAIIILPLLGSIASGFFGRKIGVSGAQYITSTSVITTTFLATISFFEVGLNSISVSIPVFRWLDSESLNVLWSFNFDSLTVSMLIPVLIVSSLVHMYSIGYMSHDPHNQRFFSYLSLFTFMMIILVTANNYLLMFVGWEGVGVCSYLLVSFWFTRIAANQSSMSAFLTNRVGDCFLTLGMFCMLWTFGNLDYSTVFSLAPYINGNIVTIIGICLLIGAMAKSSQIGLHVWLPLAMEGPTPVSALIHAATMVTAGVYLLIRSSPLIEYSSTVLMACLWIGSITTVFSSLIGLFQQDIKKVIAYSTMSQLGMMVIAVGLSSYNIALFHLVNHAFYKGLLFLGAGAVIHAVGDNQDFRRYGGLLGFLPLTYTVMFIASLSLVAFPFMTGFYSKDLILESAFGQYSYPSIAVYFTATIGAIFTTLYSVKVLYLTFLTNPNGPITNYRNAHEGDIFMSLPLIILAVFSIFFGYMAKDIFIGLASGFFMDNSLFIHPLHEINLNTEFAVPTLFKLLPLIFTVFFSVIALVLSEAFPGWLIYFKFTRLGYNIFSFFNLRFLVEILYNKFITIFIFKLGGQTTKVLDKGSIELIGPHGLEIGLVSLSKKLSSLDTGVITSYALYILISLILYMLIPYISYIDISIVLSIIYTLYIVNINLSKQLVLRNPPKYHAFVTLPLTSGYSFNPKTIIKNAALNMTVSKIAAGFATASLIVLVRYVIHGGVVFNPLDIVEGLNLAAIGVMARLVIEGIVRGYLEPMGMNYTINQIFTGIDKPQVFQMNPNPSGDNNSSGSGTTGSTGGQTSGALVPVSRPGPVSSPNVEEGTYDIATSSSATPLGQKSRPILPKPRKPLEEEGWRPILPEPTQPLEQVGRPILPEPTQQPPFQPFTGFNSIADFKKYVENNPIHNEGKGKGWGVLGNREPRVIKALLESKPAVGNHRLHRLFNIPPVANESMLSARDTFWGKIARNHDTSAPSDGLVSHTNVSQNHYYHHKTGININTSNCYDREQLKQSCTSSMATLKDSVLKNASEFEKNKNPQVEKAYWQSLHEFLGVRHFYQLYLVDNRTDVPNAST